MTADRAIARSSGLGSSLQGLFWWPGVGLSPIDACDERCARRQALHWKCRLGLVRGTLKGVCESGGCNTAPCGHF
jgi:hypothetical protein